MDTAQTFQDALIMSSDVLTSLDKQPSALTSKLRSLRRRVALWFTVDGLNRLMIALLAFVGVDLAIDWTFRMDRAQRGIMLALAALVLLWVLWRYLLKPLFTKISDEALCLEIEKHGGQSEALITALEFSREDWSKHPNVAPGLVREAIAKGLAAGDAAPVSGVLRQGRFWGNVLVLAVLVLVSVGLGVACTKTKVMGTWFNRNVLLGNAAWPQDFYLQVANAEGQTLHIPRGDDYVLEAVIEEGYRYLPEEVKLEFRTQAGRRLETMDRSDDGKDYRYQMLSVTEPLSFRLTSKKVKTEWFQVELLQRPELEEIELMTKPPAYTETGPSTLPAGQGPYYVLRGSSLGVRGQADKPLRSAQLLSGEARWPLEVREQQFGGVVPAEALVSGSYTLEIEDTEEVLQNGEETPRGLGTREPVRFKLRLKDDATPKIKARLYGVSGMVVSRARLPVAATLSDDFAIKDVQLAWQWREDTSETEETTGAHVPSGAEALLGQATIELDEPFEIEALEIPAGSRLSFHLAATDNDVVTGPKIGKSTELIVRVVNEAELRDDLLRREKEQRQLVAELVDQQDLLLTECQALSAQTRTGDLSSEQRSEAVRFVKRQNLVSNGLRPVVGRLRGMVAEITNNKLEDDDGVLRERLRERIIDPLEALTENELTLAAEYLSRLRRADAQERQVYFTAAITNQQAALKQLREILIHMVKNESYQQAVNLLYEIQKSQEDLRKRTEKEKESLLEKVLQDPKEEAADGETNDSNVNETP